MNAISVIERAPCPDALTRDGHAFRGQFLDKCAAIEAWATPFLPDGPSRKSAYLFGQKLKVVRDLAAGNSPPFKSPARVIKLLDAFEPLGKLRTILAHSRQRVAMTTNREELVIYQPIEPTAWMHVVLTRPDMKELLREVTAIAKQLSDQKPARASAPPQLARAATIAP